MAASPDYTYNRFLARSGLMEKGPKASPPKTFGVAIFGLGRAGSIHLMNVLQTPRLRLLYLVDGQTERLQIARQNYCLPDTVALVADSDTSAVLADDRVDAVIIATPTQRHTDLVAAALTAKKDVLCEKPIAQDLDLVRSCYDLARRNGRTLLCAFHRRFDPAFSAVYSDIRAGRVGTVWSLSSVSRDCPKPSMAYLKSSCGIFHDTFVHDVDMMCHAMGEFPQRVLASAHSFCPQLEELGDYDTVVGVLQFPRGQLATVNVSRESTYGYDQRFEVHGSKGMVRAENQRPTSYELYTAEGGGSHPILFSFPSRYAEAYLRETEHFLALLDGTAEPAITEEAVVKVTKVILALEESIRTSAFVTVRY